MEFAQTDSLSLTRHLITSMILSIVLHRSKKLMRNVSKTEHIKQASELVGTYWFPAILSVPLIYNKAKGKISGIYTSNELDRAVFLSSFLELVDYQIGKLMFRGKGKPILNRKIYHSSLSCYPLHN